MLTVLDYGRNTFGATCTGAAKELVKRAREHAINRYQFKRPLASFALVKQKIAWMNALLYAMESATYLTAGLVDEGVEDFMLEAAMLKVFTSESLWTIVYDTMQIFGGRSFFTDAPFERMMRDARLNMIGEGSNEVLRAFIGAVGLRDVGMELKGVKDAAKNPFKNWSALTKFGKKSMRYLKAEPLKMHSGKLEEDANRLAEAVRTFGISVVKVLAQFGEEVVEKQLVLDRLATTAIALYTITAVLSRLDSTENVSKTDFDSGKFYCRRAFALIDKCRRELFNNDDNAVEALSDEITQVKRR